MLLEGTVVTDPYRLLTDAAARLLGPLQEIAEKVIENKQFQRAPGGKRHHSYPGGLMQHTAEVVEYAGLMLPGGDSWHEVTIAAVVHDLFKILEYEFWNGETVTTEFEHTIGHVVMGWKFWVDEAEKRAADISPKMIASVSHALLAHHGRREWGSPKEPRTLVAFALHSADMLSVKQAQRREGK